MKPLIVLAIVLSVHLPAVAGAGSALRGAFPTLPPGTHLRYEATTYLPAWPAAELTERITSVKQRANNRAPGTAGIVASEENAFLAAYCRRGHDSTMPPHRADYWGSGSAELWWTRQSWIQPEFRDAVAADGARFVRGGLGDVAPPLLPAGTPPQSGGMVTVSQWDMLNEISMPFLGFLQPNKLLCDVLDRFDVREEGGTLTGTWAYAPAGGNAQDPPLWTYTITVNGGRLSSITQTSYRRSLDRAYTFADYHDIGHGVQVPGTVVETINSNIYLGRRKWEYFVDERTTYVLVEHEIIGVPAQVIAGNRPRSGVSVQDSRYTNKRYHGAYTYSGTTSLDTASINAAYANGIYAPLLTRYLQYGLPILLALLAIGGACVLMLRRKQAAKPGAAK